MAVSLPVTIILCAINTTLLFKMDVNSETEFFSWQQPIVFLLIILEQPILSLPLLLLNGRLLFEKKPAVRALFSDLYACMPSYFFRTVVMRTMQYTILGFTLITVWRGLIQFFFQGEVIALEKLKKAQIKNRCLSLAKNTSDRTVGFILIDILLGLTFLFICVSTWNFILDLFSSRGKYWFFDAQFSLLSPPAHFFFFFYAVFHSAAKFFYYIDLRSAREGWDIEIMLHKGMVETTGRP